MRVPLHKSLTGRILLFGILPMLVLVGAILAVGATDKIRTLRRIGESQLVQTAHFARSIAEDRLNDAVRTARLIAEAEAAGVVGTPEATRAFVRAVVERDPTVTAAWVVLEPPQATAKRLALRAHRDPSDPKQVLVEADDTLISGRAFLDASVIRDVAREVGGETATRRSARQLEFAYPILRAGAPRGVAGVEYAAAEVQSAAEAIARDYGVRILFLSPRKSVIAASGDTASLADQDITDTLLGPMLREVDALASSGELGVVDDPLTGERTYVAAARTRTLGAYIVVTKPLSEITAPIYAEMLRNGLIAVVGFVAITVLIVAMLLSVRRRMDGAVRLATTIADGDLSASATNVPGEDESALLLRSLDVMAARLRSLVGDVRNAAATLDGGVHELGHVTEAQRTVALPLGQGSGEVTSAASQIASTGAQLVSTMRSLESSATSTAELAGAGRANLGAVDQSMRDLDVATSSIAEKLATINERAVAINGVVTTITKVADQTNILSVNAAIEAEKAGEQGRGFLVVAREIRRLADQTASATLDIDRIVQEMQSAVSAGVMEMDRFAEKVRRGVDEVERSSSRMSEIIGQVQENTERFRSVSEGMASQSAGAAQITAAASHLQDAARTTVEGISRIGATVRELERASESLRAGVSAFRLDRA